MVPRSVNRFFYGVVVFPLAFSSYSFLCGHVVSVVLLLSAEVNKELNDVDKAVIDNGTRLRCPVKS